MNIIEKVNQLEAKANQFGFTWPDAAMILDQIRSECDEVASSMHENESRERLQEEVGDLVHATFALCFFLGLDIESTIKSNADKLEMRLDALISIAKSKGYDSLEGETLSTKMAFWDMAKKQCSD